MNYIQCSQLTLFGLFHSVPVVKEALFAWERVKGSFHSSSFTCWYVLFNVCLSFGECVNTLISAVYDNMTMDFLIAFFVYFLLYHSFHSFISSLIHSLINWFNDSFFLSCLLPRTHCSVTYPSVPKMWPARCLHRVYIFHNTVQA